MAGISFPYQFNVCVNEVNSLPETTCSTYYPIGITKDTLFKWFYRVKTWSIGWDLTSVTSHTTISNEWLTCDSGVISAPNFYSTNNSFPIDFNTGGIYSFITAFPLAILGSSSEKDFTCYNQYIQFSLAASVSDNFCGFNGVGSNAWVTIHFDETILLFNNLYYPRVEWNAGSGLLSANSQADGNIYSFKGATGCSDDSSAYNSSIPIQIDGNTFSFPTVYTSSSSTGSGGTSASTLDLDTLPPLIISPLSYWPYDPRDGGGPIYDSTTGAQLRDPFSVQTWS